MSIRIAGFFLGAVALFLPSVSNANDAKTQPSAACNYTAQGTGGIAICPIVRDNVTNTTGLADFEVRVNESNSNGDDVECTLYSLDEDENIIDSSYRTTSVSNGYETLNWSNSLNVSESGGYYQLNCFFGLSDEIIFYYWDEP